MIEVRAERGGSVARAHGGRPSSRSTSTAAPPSSPPAPRTTWSGSPTWSRSPPPRRRRAPTPSSAATSSTRRSSTCCATTQPGRGGEIQLTDALQQLAGDRAEGGGGVHGVVFRGRRYDTGDRLDYLRPSCAWRANVRTSARELRAWLRELRPGGEATVVKSVDEHLAACLRGDRLLAPIELQLLDAQGCVLAEDVVARTDLPPFDNRAMDGYAVHAADIAGAREQSRWSCRSSATSRPAPARRSGLGPGHGRPDHDRCPAAGRRRRRRPGRADRRRHRPRSRSTGAVPPGRARPPRRRATCRPGRRRARRRAPASARRRSACSPRSAATAVLARPQPARRGALHRQRARPARRSRWAPARSATPTASPSPRPRARRARSRFRVGDRPRRARAAARRHRGPARSAPTWSSPPVGSASAPTTSSRRCCRRLGTVEFDAGRHAARQAPGLRHHRPGRTPLFALPGNPVSAYVSFEVFVRPVIRQLLGRRDVHRPRSRGVCLDGASPRPAGKRQFARGRARSRGRPATVVDARSAGAGLATWSRALAHANCPDRRPRGRHRGARPGGTVEGHGAGAAASQVESGFTHLDDAGAARMVDVSGKDVTARTATASGRVLVSAGSSSCCAAAAYPRATPSPSRGSPASGRQAHARPDPALPPDRDLRGRRRPRGRRRRRGDHRHRADRRPHGRRDGGADRGRRRRARPHRHGQGGRQGRGHHRRPGGGEDRRQVRRLAPATATP